MRLKSTPTPRPKQERTASKSSPSKRSRMGCLCWNKPVYSTKCCDKSMGAQGVGLIYKKS